MIAAIKMTAIIVVKTTARKLRPIASDERTPVAIVIIKTNRINANAAIVPTIMAVRQILARENASSTYSPSSSFRCGKSFFFFFL